MSRQCELLGLPRSCWYYREQTDPLRLGEDERLMRWIDAQYTRSPFFGVMRMTATLRRAGEEVNVKRVRRLMRLMGLEAIYPKPRTSVKDPVNTVYPYLLKDLKIDRIDQVWCTDITYIPLSRGWAYLVAVMDWFSRFVLSWEMSVTLDASFCVDALKRSLAMGTPEIFNSDQGSQFTSSAFTGVLKAAGVRISMDGRGRAFDNIFIGRCNTANPFYESNTLFSRDFCRLRPQLAVAMLRSVASLCIGSICILSSRRCALRPRASIANGRVARPVTHRAARDKEDRFNRQLPLRSFGFIVTRVARQIVSARSAPPRIKAD